nr:immunoglobulin heavy chain junction region [Macaca mulatta]MOW90704.1 immunoglobulin heavy chain junction region [Macaca mulatta]MOW92921.1 immunoglobulin heavy chain junction region [Macaca mulatta]
CARVYTGDYAHYPLWYFDSW